MILGRGSYRAHSNIDDQCRFSRLCPGELCRATSLQRSIRWSVYGYGGRSLGSEMLGVVFGVVMEGHAEVRRIG